MRQETIEASAYHPMLQRGDFDVAMDFQCSFVVEPDMDIDKFQSVGISDRNFGRYKDPVLDDLFMKQARALDPEERKRYLRAFEKRLLDEEAHYLWTLQNHRIVPHSAKVRGWTITTRHGVARGVVSRGSQEAQWLSPAGRLEIPPCRLW